MADTFGVGAELLWAAGLELGLTEFVAVVAELVAGEAGLAAAVGAVVDLAVGGVACPPPESLVVPFSAVFVSMSGADLSAVAVAFVVEE